MNVIRIVLYEIYSKHPFFLNFKHKNKLFFLCDSFVPYFMNLPVARLHGVEWYER
jgi:hypothetical protein